MGNQNLSSLIALSKLSNFIDQKIFVNLVFTLCKWPSIFLFDILDFIENKLKTLPLKGLLRFPKDVPIHKLKT